MSLQELVKKNVRQGQKFASIRLIYTYAKPKIQDNAVSFERGYSVYEAYPFEDSDPILLLDEQNIISGLQGKYTIEPLEPSSFEQIWEKMTPQERLMFKRLIKKWGFVSKEDNVRKVLFNKIYKPRFRLKDPSLITSEEGRKNWSELLNVLLSYGSAEKDTRLREVFKTHLLRGYKQRYNPHAIVATNPATGKSVFYENVGPRYDKVTGNSLIGYSKGSGEIYYGAIHNQSHTLTIEQIESQIAETFLGFLLTFMESGNSLLTVGGVEMKISGTSPIVLTANPTGYDSDAINSFKSLLDHLTSNRMALGRRFGLIVFGNDYKTVDTGSYFDEEEWSRYFELLRAVEEYAWPIIEKIYRNKEVLRWLNTPILKYKERVMATTDKIYDKDAKDFIKAHAENGFRHTRGGALSCAILDLMPEVLEYAEDGDMDLFIDCLLGRADEHLDQLVSINLDSFANMSKILESNDQIKEYLMDSYPKYLREIIVMVQSFRDKNPKTPNVLPIEAAESYFQKRFYGSLSEVLSVLKGSERWRFFSPQLEKYFSFKIVKNEGGQFVFVFTNI